MHLISLLLDDLCVEDVAGVDALASECNFIMLVAADGATRRNALMLLDLHEALWAGSGPVEQLLGLVLCQAGHDLVLHLIFILFDRRGLLCTPIATRNDSTTLYSLILLIESDDLIFIHMLLLASLILITGTLLCRPVFHTGRLTDDVGSSEEAPA